MYMLVLKIIPSTMSSFVLVSLSQRDPTNWWPSQQEWRSPAGFCSSTFATGFVSPWRFSGRTWYWFYQDTTKIISRKRFYVIMLCIYIGSFDFKTSYKYFLPWQHLPEVGENLLSLHYQKKPEAKQHRVSGQRVSQQDWAAWRLWASKRPCSL